MANKILEVRDFSYYYGEIKAVDNLSFYVEEGEVVTLIGGNGAGKTTTLRAISGLIRGGQRFLWFVPHGETGSRRRSAPA